jgi:hypothetical protein
VSTCKKENLLLLLERLKKSLEDYPMLVDLWLRLKFKLEVEVKVTLLVE